ncbi:MAG TPA: TetR family transcriptional regulator [Ktedonobacterales bacterium]|nr:TetR family transcriptional regulator [Ktedonobacterales bacterium]
MGEPYQKEHISGLRERKKRQTRETIADVALGLFIERGFDAVTVAEIAQAAEVAVKTVFNYFPTKEDLFFDRQAEVEDAWSRVARKRASGESVVAALRRDFLDKLARRDPSSGLNEDFVTFARLIQSSPSLQVREREIGERSRDALARTLVAESGAASDDLTPRLVASLVEAIYRTLHAESRRRLLAGERANAIYPDMLAAANRAFDLLETGIGSYGLRQL